MRDGTREALALRRRLSTRLRPLALAIGVLISLGLPLTYYVLQFNALRRDAETSAMRLAARIPAVRDTEATVRDFTQSLEAVVVRVQDARPGAEVPEVLVVTPLAERWWNRLVPVGVAPVLIAGEVVGRAEVRLAQGTLIAVTIGLFIMSTLTGVGLAFLVYAVPVRVVGGMENRLAGLVAEQESLIAAGRALASSLDLRDVLGHLAQAAGSLPGIDVVHIWLRDPVTGEQTLATQSGALRSLEGPTRALPPDEGLSGTVIRTREPLAIVDAPEDPRLINRQWYAAEGLSSFLGVPLLVGDTVLGALSCISRARREWSPTEIALAETLGGFAAVAIKNARLFEQSERLYAGAMRREVEAEELARIARVLSESLDVTDVGDRIAASVLPLFEARSSGLYALEADGSFRGIAWGGAARSRYTAGQRFPAGDGVIGWVVAHNQPVANADVLADPRFIFPEPRRSELAAGGNSAVLAVPLRTKGALIGVLAVADKPGRAFSDAELALLQAFADQAALALENARLYQRAQQAYAELAEAQDRLVRGETLRAMGELASGVAHHLNNLLAVILGRIQLSLGREPSPDIARHLGIAERATLDGAEVIRRMRGFGREEPDEDLAPIDLNALVGEMLALTRPRWEDEAHVRGVTITTRLDAGVVPPVRGEIAPLREVVMNLVLNAVDAMPEGGHITVRTWAEDEWVYASVTDTGVGMSAEVKRRALEPFFTTKGVRSTGLGLSVNYGIIQRFGGELTIDSVEGEGTTITFKLPAAHHPAPPAAPPVTALPRRLRVLVIDDEPEVRTLLAEILDVEGHDAVEAASGAEGLRALDGDPGIDVVLSDLGMPGMTGWDVARAVKSRRPDLPVVLVTGWGDDPEGRPEDRRAADVILSKPVTPQSLHEALARAVGAR